MLTHYNPIAEYKYLYSQSTPHLTSLPSINLANPAESYKAREISASSDKRLVTRPWLWLQFDELLHFSLLFFTRNLLDKNKACRRTHKVQSSL